MTTPFEPARVRAITFDCFGTLIDWPRGILRTLKPLAERYGVSVDDTTLLSTYARLEREAQQPATGAYRPYREILRSVTRSLLGAACTRLDAETLESALPRWHPFADTLPALDQLRAIAPLGVLSNIDDDLFEPILKTLGHPFTLVVTAQQVRSYKPALPHFQTAMERLGLEAGSILHVAESRYHDIEPASALGMQTVWVDRGASASGDANTQPTFRVSTLKELADLLEADRAGG